MINKFFWHFSATRTFECLFWCFMRPVNLICTFWCVLVSLIVVTKDINRTRLVASRLYNLRCPPSQLRSSLRRRLKAGGKHILSALKYSMGPLNLLECSLYPLCVNNSLTTYFVVRRRMRCSLRILGFIAAILETGISFYYFVVNF